MITGQLSQIAQTRLVQHLRLLPIGQTTHISFSRAFGQSVFTQHIKQVSEFQFIFSVKYKCPIVHCTQSHIVGILVIDIIIEIHRLIGIRRINTETGIRDILYRFISITIIDIGSHTYICPALGFEPPINRQR